MPKVLPFIDLRAIEAMIRFSKATNLNFVTSTYGFWYIDGSVALNTVTFIEFVGLQTGDCYDRLSTVVIVP